MDLVANSTPIVDLDSRLNSFLVNLDRRLDFPTPESPIKTTEKKNKINGGGHFDTFTGPMLFFGYRPHLLIYFDGYW